MTEAERENTNPDEIDDPKEALLFIRGVISSSRRGGKGDGGLGSFLAALLTIGAGLATWWMIANSFDYIWYVWAGHNGVLISIWISEALRGGETTRRDRQILAIWILTTIAIWAVIIPLSAFGVIKWWGVFAIIPAFVGMGTVTGGILVWNKFEMALGGVLVLSVPPLLYMESASYIGSVALIVLFALIGGVVERIQYKKLMNAN